MNTLSKVYSKLNSKTELATHKVELGIAQDIKKVLARAKKVSTVGKKQEDKNADARMKYEKEWEKSRPIIKDASQVTKELLAIEKDAIKAAKELGVKPDLIAGFSALQGAYDSVQGLEKYLDFPLPK
jgi:hypothetical protein